jgi:hypothetical protein
MTYFLLAKCFDVYHSPRCTYNYTNEVKVIILYLYFPEKTNIRDKLGYDMLDLVNVEVISNNNSDINMQVHARDYRITIFINSFQVVCFSGIVIQ